MQIHLVEFHTCGFSLRPAHLIAQAYRVLGKVHWTHVALMIHDEKYQYAWLIDNTWSGTNFYAYNCVLDLEFADWHDEMRVTRVTHHNKDRVDRLAKLLYSAEARQEYEDGDITKFMSYRLGIPPWFKGSLTASWRYWRGKTMRKHMDYICTDIISYLCLGPLSVQHLTPNMLRDRLCDTDDSLVINLKPIEL